MILETAARSTPNSSTASVIRLPAGMVGLPEATEFELTASETHWPLMWLRSTGPDHLAFPVVEPGPLVSGYQIELSDADAEELEIRSAADTPLVLAVVTVRSLQPQKVTANLIGPVVVNRRTMHGKQVVIANCDCYSVDHILIDEANQNSAAAC